MKQHIVETAVTAQSPASAASSSSEEFLDIPNFLRFGHADHWRNSLT
jgi:hypothetical protein